MVWTMLIGVMRNLSTQTVLVMMLSLCGCAAHGAAGLDDLPSYDEQSEDVNVEAGLRAMIPTIDKFIHRTAKGENIGDMTLGLFISNILGKLSAMDEPLSARLHQGGRFIDGYLSEVFQYQDQKEVDEIAAMAQPGNLPARKAAAAALECLRHIPNKKTDPAEQKVDREELSKALAALKSRLDDIVSQSSPP